MMLIGLCAAVFLFLEILFFSFCFRWLSSGKRIREREFARLDAERAELLEMQSDLSRSMAAARQLSQETLEKLSHIGAEAHAEWLEVNRRTENVREELESRTEEFLNEHMALLQRQKLSFEKARKDAVGIEISLREAIEKSEKILKFFDDSVPTDHIVKEIQTEKYAEAKRLLDEGVDASAVSRKLGITLSEVSLLSYMR